MHTDSSQRTIQEFQHTDEAAVVDVWHRSGRATYTFLPTWQAFTLEQARWVFANIILVESEHRQNPVPWPTGWGLDKLKGLKIAHVFIDNDYGRETMPILDYQAAQFGFMVQHLAVSPPGLDQKATWLRVG
jgi:hypothetical protein